MNNLFKLFAAAIAAGIVVHSSTARAEDPSCARISRANIVRCAEAASLAVRAQQTEVDVAVARRAAVSPLLPSNPVLAFTGARRTGNDGVPPRVYNWSATLSQELEIAGQRGLRREAAAEEITAQRRRRTVTERDVAADALDAYFDALAAAELGRLASRLEAMGTRMAAVTRARADSGVASPLEAEVAESMALGLVRARLGADRDHQLALVRLSTLLGRDPTAPLDDVDGELVPLDDLHVAASSASARIAEQPEVQAYEASRRFYEGQASALQRSRLPNPTIQAFAQNDGFDERVYGLGLSIPVPLPYPLGRTKKGEIAEDQARAAQASIEVERQTREMRQRLAVAMRTYESRRAEIASFTRERIERAEKVLADISTEIERGRLAVRDALLGQQTLIEMLRGHIEARHALCSASVELSRAAGVDLERGAR